MEKEASVVDASLDEWELLPDHRSFMESIGQHNYGGKDYYYYFSKELFFDPKLVVNMNYFNCPISDPSPCCILETKETSSSAQVETKPVVPSPIVVTEVVPNDDKLRGSDEHESIKDFKDIGVLPPSIKSNQQVMPKLIAPSTIEHEQLVYHEELCKAKEVEHKLVDVVAYEDQEEEEESGNTEEYIKSDEVKGKHPCCFTVWKWRVNGIGALCSMGVAAATICIFLFGGRQQQQKIQFQIYADDKRINQMAQRASRLNQAMSAAARGVPVTRASISFGGYYDGL